MRRYGRVVDPDEDAEPTQLADLPLFRRDDPATSRSAAATLRAHLSEIQLAVLVAYRTHGRMSAREVEQLPEFTGYGFSTIRKRVSELAAVGVLRPAGSERESGASPCTVYEIAR